MSKLNVGALILFAVAIWVLGCTREGQLTQTVEPNPYAASGSEVAIAAALAELPVAPWAASPLQRATAPEPIVAAWSGAANRDWCAPLAPLALGAGDGATARVAELDGGWSVEFDVAGAPGVNEDGTLCDDCGRAAFGIAGTGMTPEELAVEELPPSFNDGSHAEFSVDEDGATVAAATIAIEGQDCVYQVWSFLGEDHARQLVDDLRFVSVVEGATDALATTELPTWR